MRQVCEHTTITTIPKLTLSPRRGRYGWWTRSRWPRQQYLEANGSDENELQKHLVYDGAAAAAAGGWGSTWRRACSSRTIGRRRCWRCWRRGTPSGAGSGAAAGPADVGGGSAGDAGVGGGRARAAVAGRAFRRGRTCRRTRTGGHAGGDARRAAGRADVRRGVAGDRGFGEVRGAKDLSPLLVNGAEAAGGWAGGGWRSSCTATPGRRTHGAEDWYLWDAWANAGTGAVVEADVARGDEGRGVGVARGDAGERAGGAYAGDTSFEQTWSAAADLSTYQVTTSRAVTRGLGARGRGRGSSSG